MEASSVFSFLMATVLCVDVNTAAGEWRQWVFMTRHSICSFLDPRKQLLSLVTIIAIKFSTFSKGVLKTVYAGQSPGSTDNWLESLQQCQSWEGIIIHSSLLCYFNLCVFKLNYGCYSFRNLFWLQSNLVVKGFSYVSFKRYLSS